MRQKHFSRWNIIDGEKGNFPSAFLCLIFPWKHDIMIFRLRPFPLFYIFYFQKKSAWLFFQMCNFSPKEFRSGIVWQRPWCQLCTKTERVFFYIQFGCLRQWQYVWNVICQTYYPHVQEEWTRKKWEKRERARRDRMTTMKEQWQ